MLVLPMAERCAAGLAARLAAALDARAAALIALDEGAEPEEALAPCPDRPAGLLLDLDGRLMPRICA